MASRTKDLMSNTERELRRKNPEAFKELPKTYESGITSGLRAMFAAPGKAIRAVNSKVSDLLSPPEALRRKARALGEKAKRQKELKEDLKKNPNPNMAETVERYFKATR